MSPRVWDSGEFPWNREIYREAFVKPADYLGNGNTPAEIIEAHSILSPSAGPIPCSDQIREFLSALQGIWRAIAGNATMAGEG